MPQAIYRSPGKTIPHTPSGALSSGDVVVTVDLIGVAVNDIAASALGALYVEGIFTLPKESGSSTAIPAGTIVYWDNTNDRATATSSGNKRIGKVITAAVDGDTTVEVLMQQG